jgi:16S rRNA (cytosine967-C5)-methyltransferase
LFADGLCSVQDESGQLVLDLLEPVADGWLVDACAAPGGKLTGVLERRLNGYKIIGLDVNMQRLKILQQNCRRLGLQNYVLIQNDATRPALRRSNFKQILIDAPCSGLGSIQKHPDIKWRRSLPEILEFQICN